MKKIQVVSEIDKFVPSTGIFHIFSLDHMKKINSNAIVRNSEHFDNETGGCGLEGLEGKQADILLQVDRSVFADGHCLVVFASGPKHKLACATDHPSFSTSCSFMNQVPVQLDLLRNWKTRKPYKNDVHLGGVHRAEQR